MTTTLVISTPSDFDTSKLYLHTLIFGMQAYPKTNFTFVSQKSHSCFSYRKFY